VIISLRAADTLKRPSKGGRGSLGQFVVTDAVAWKICGVYAVVGPGGRRYIGGSKSIWHRWRWHLRALCAGRHKNDQLQEAWDEFGAVRFRLELIERCALGALSAREQFWLEQLGDYNICPVVGRPPDTTGIRLRPERRAQLAAMSKAVNGRPENRAKMSDRSRKLWQTPEHRERMRLVRVKYWSDPKNRERRRQQALQQHAEGRLGRVSR